MRVFSRRSFRQCRMTLSSRRAYVLWRRGASDGSGQRASPHCGGFPYPRYVRDGVVRGRAPWILREIYPDFRSTFPRRGIRTSRRCQNRYPSRRRTGCNPVDVEGTVSAHPRIYESGKCFDCVKSLRGTPREFLNRYSRFLAQLGGKIERRIAFAIFNSRERCLASFHNSSERLQGKPWLAIQPIGFKRV